MKYYGYSYPGKSGVTTDYRDIQTIIKLYPYPKFRCFLNEKDALHFAELHKVATPIASLYHYGDVLENHYVSVQYFILENKVCYNIFHNKMGCIRFNTDDDNISIDARGDVTMVAISNIFLDEHKIGDHAVAVYHILKLIGDFIDVDLELPYRCIYYALTAYTGTDYNICRVQNLIESRVGCLSYSVRRW